MGGKINMSNLVRKDDEPKGFFNQLFSGREKKERRELNDLMKQVAKKLTHDMHYGRVSFFSDKKTRLAQQEVYTIALTSVNHPDMDARIWKRFTPPKDTFGPSYRFIFEIWDFQYPTTEKSTKFSIAQHWNGDLEMRFNRDDKPISHREKVKFLTDVLETLVDKERLESYFGKPYQPGDSVSYTGSHDLHEHAAFWVRDLAPNSVSLLDSGPLVEPKMLE